MSSIHTSPEPEKIKQTLTRARRNCQEMELAGIQMEEMIAKLDREILTQRKQRLVKALEHCSSSSMMIEIGRLKKPVNPVSITAPKDLRVLPFFTATEIIAS